MSHMMDCRITHLNCGNDELFELSIAAEEVNAMIVQLAALYLEKNKNQST